MQLDSSALPSFASDDLAGLEFNLEGDLGDVGDLLSLLHEDEELLSGTGAAEQPGQHSAGYQEQLQHGQASSKGTGKRARSSTSGSSQRTAGGTLKSAAPKTADSQLECQKRWRAKEKTRAQELQAAVEAKVAEAERLAAINRALRSKQELLESVVAVREDQLRTLHTGQHAVQQLTQHTVQQPAQHTVQQPTQHAGCNSAEAAPAAAGNTINGSTTQGTGQQPPALQSMPLQPQCQQVAAESTDPDALKAVQGDNPNPNPDDQSNGGSVSDVQRAVYALIGNTQQLNTTTARMGGQANHHVLQQGIEPAPAADQPLPPLGRIPPVPLWDAAWIARLKHTTAKEWQTMWHDFVKEASMHVLAAEAHGPGSPAHETLTQVVSQYLGIIDRITLLVPSLYYDSLYINLATGERQPPPATHWVTVAKALAPTHQQIREGMTALSAFDETMTGVLQERANIKARITQHLSPSKLSSVEASTSTSIPATQHASSIRCQEIETRKPETSSGVMSVSVSTTTGMQAQPLQQHEVHSLQQPQPANTCGSGLGLMTQAAEEPQAPKSGLAAQASATLTSGLNSLTASMHSTGLQAGSIPGQSFVRGMQGMVPGVQEVGAVGVGHITRPSCDLASLTQQLSSNMAKEHAAHDMVSDFLCTRVLSVVQLARAAAVSWPWLPDVTAILKEGVAALSSSQ